jgi:hypothetical protein
MNDEIKQLTREEYEKIKEAARSRTRQTRVERNAQKIAQNEMLVGEEGLEIGAKCWNMRKAGASLHKIARELNVPIAVLEECLREFEARVSMEAGRLMTHFLALDNERIEDMLSYWLPLAQSGPIMIEKVRDGEVFSEPDFDRPLKASYFVLHAIQMRLKMLMASARPGEASAVTTNNIVLWLQQVMPGASAAVGHSRTQAKDNLVLETAAESENL